MLHFIVQDLDLVLGQTITRDLHETVDFVNVDVLDVLITRLVVAGLLRYFGHACYLVKLISAITYIRQHGIVSNIA